MNVVLQMKPLKYSPIIVSILALAAVLLPVCGEEAKKTPNPADEARPALPPLKPLFEVHPTEAYVVGKTR